MQFLGDIFENDSNDTINAAMGVELLHNFTLVHDDIMDEDTLRHNVTTIQKNGIMPMQYCLEMRWEH
ncbi:MAG: hypothetical protein CM1200mP31_4520 [Candidatus Neomarinimicrobiota bacterium]|nr:MAG: hypothetical protein CM1200mP31_4520 [Candidatus Neomarinimicrobiota bacterium]